MSQFILLAIVLWMYISFCFLLSVIKKRNDVADIAWGLGFVLMAWTSYALSESKGENGFIASILVTIWGVRLSWHIFLRNRHKKEDYRYQSWRQQWGKWFYLRSYLQVFFLQGVLLFIIAQGIIVANQVISPQILPLTIIGTFIWIFGFGFESIADWQLANFIKQPQNKGQLIQSGLWRYSRHPNYFGEVIMWFGIWLVAISDLNNFWSIISPLTITFLITQVSGIPLTEKHMQKKPGFAKYSRQTSIFFPLPPKP